MGSYVITRCRGWGDMLAAIRHSRIQTGPPPNKLLSMFYELEERGHIRAININRQRSAGTNHNPILAGSAVARGSGGC